MKPVGQVVFRQEPFVVRVLRVEDKLTVLVNTLEGGREVVPSERVQGKDVLQIQLSTQSPGDLDGSSPV